MCWRYFVLMEYTYRSSSHEMPTTILLSEYNLTVRQGKQETVIPYAGINEVIINRGADKVYKTYLQPDDGKPLVVTNKYYTEREAEDRSRAYSTFIRVLHFHLKDKSKAHFTSGSRKAHIGWWILGAVTISFVLALLLDFVSKSIFSVAVDTVALSVLLVVIVLSFKLGRLPKSYHPTDIPLEFLP